MRFEALLLALGASWILLTGCAPPDPRPSIVLVVLDTVRRDHTGLHDAETGEYASVTPRLDAFARDAAVWINASSNAPWTVPSHASMFTGLLPSRHGCTSANPRFAPSSSPLAEILAASGYRTEAFYSNPWLLDEVTGLLRGFDEHVFAADPGPDRGDGADQGGREILDSLARRLDDQRDGEPFFFYVNFLESHVPYDPPRSIRSEYGPTEGRVDSEWILDVQADLRRPQADEWNEVRRLYAGDVRAADRFFGELVELLEARGFFGSGDDGNSGNVLIVTSDHGESLGEGGFVEHQLHLRESLLDVPLAIRAPGLEAGRRPDPAMSTDLFATILAWADPERTTPDTSRSLLRRISPDRPQIGEYAGAPQALLRHLHERNPDFDLAAGARAYRAVRTSQGWITSEAESLGAPIDPDSFAAEADGASPEMSEEIRKRLRDLGYLQ